MLSEAKSFRGRLFLLALLLLALDVSTVAAAAAPEGPQLDPVFDLDAILATPLDARILKSTEADGIVTEEVMFHSEMDGDRRVEIFAFFCYPAGASKLPAFIWNQAGCAMADTYFATFGAKRGYAVLCIDFPIPGYRSSGGYLINSGLELGDDPQKAPIYHGAVALLKAVSFLRSRPEVDPDRIGMAGTSWGGFFTTLMVGVDPRLKAGSAMFGCGALHLGNAWWDTQGRSRARDAAFRERWRTTLDPAWRLALRKTPMAWFTGTNDTFYWLPAMMASYATAAGPKHLSLLPNWDHGLTPTLDEQVFVWLDVHLKGAPAFISVSPLAIQTSGNDVLARWRFTGPRKVKSADLMVSYGGDGNWVSRYWKVLRARVRRGVCEVKLPRSPLAYFVAGSVTDADGFRYSTPIVLVDPGEHGLLDPDAAIQYNGCSAWGDFERAGISYLRGLAILSKPEVSSNAKAGKQALVLRGEAAIRGIYYTPSVPDRFSCYMKADSTTDISVELDAQFDAQTESVRDTFTVGTGWTHVSLGYMPREALWSTLRVIFRVPEGATVLLDEVRFQPVADHR